MHRTLTEYLKNMPDIQDIENNEQKQNLIALQKQIVIAANEEYTEEEKGGQGGGPGMPAIKETDESQQSLSSSSGQHDGGERNPSSWRQLVNDIDSSTVTREEEPTHPYDALEVDFLPQRV